MLVRSWSKYSSSVNCMPGTVLSDVNILMNSVLITTQQDRLYYTHFIGEETVAQLSEVISPRSHSQSMTMLRIRPQAI